MSLRRGAPGRGAGAAFDFHQEATTMTTRTSTNRSTVVGVFTDAAQARQCVSDLRKAGFSESQIGVAGRDDEAAASVAGDKGSKMAAGAATGVAAGAGVGALWA